MLKPLLLLAGLLAIGGCFVDPNSVCAPTSKDTFKDLVCPTVDAPQQP